MSQSTMMTSAVAQLRSALAKADKSTEIKGIIAARDQVLARYQQVFAPDHLPLLTEDEFKGFLLFRNNQHWTGLARKGYSLCADMSRLREALSLLLDEGQPIDKRLDRLIPKAGHPFMQKFGRALITAILNVTHPDKYGVYNGTSEAGMKAVGVLPLFERGASFSERYVEVNKTFHELTGELGIDLWTLDALWWLMKPGDDGETDSGSFVDELEEDVKSFGLERHLQNFMVDNWSKLTLGNDWDLFEEDEEVVGYEYDTGEVGRIDLLARHKSKPRWLVMELKRNQTSDDTVGQVLRYMGWVKENLAKEGEVVQGLIIARQTDAKMRYALMNTVNVGFMCYRVEFYLSEPTGLPGIPE